jgi:hypothetical protein
MPNLNADVIESLARARHCDYRMLSARLRDRSVSTDELDFLADVLDGKIEFMKAKHGPQSFERSERNWRIYQLARAEYNLSGSLESAYAAAVEGMKREGIKIKRGTAFNVFQAFEAIFNDPDDQRELEQRAEEYERQPQTEARLVDGKK